MPTCSSTVVVDAGAGEANLSVVSRALTALGTQLQTGIAGVPFSYGFRDWRKRCCPSAPAGGLVTNHKAHKLLLLIAILLALSAFAFTAEAQTPPPAPTLVEPAAGAALVQPIALAWTAVVDPDGPIGSYTWQVSNSSAFTTIIASGFTNLSDIPASTRDKVSGLPNGTYFWRVKATQLVGGVVFALDSPWSTVQSFTVVGLGPAPGTPTFTSPATPAQFHVREFFLINWTDVVDAHHYVLEADDEPTFSYPLTLTTDPMKFGTSFRAGWGNPLNAFYRIVAVSADGVRSLPSPTLAVQITNAAPVPPPPTPLFPVGGATVTLPFTLRWTETANPQVAGYDVDIDNEPNFLGAVGVLLAQGVSRSDYMVVPDPLVEGFNIFPPGTYFWRVRAVHGDVLGPWSAGQSFTVAPLPPTPPGLAVFHIINEPGSVSGGNSTQARVTLNMPAPPGGALVNLATDFPHAQIPTSVVVPEGKTDATVSPITTIPVPGATIGSVRAAYGLGWQDNSLGLWPILWGISLDHDTVVGGNPVLGTATLLNPAPPGGVEVALVNGDNTVITLPATVFIPAGGTGAARKSSCRAEPCIAHTRVRQNSRRRQHDGDRDAHRARAGGRRGCFGVRQHGGASGHATMLPTKCDRAGGQPQRQFPDHGASGERAALCPHSSELRRHRRHAGQAARDRSGPAGRLRSLRVRHQQHDGRDRRRVDARDRLDCHASAGRRRCGDADQR